MTNPLLWLFNFFHSWLHFIYAMFTTKEIGPPIIADRLTGRVERELETVNHRFKMYLMYNYVTELRERSVLDSLRPSVTTLTWLSLASNKSTALSASESTFITKVSKLVVPPISPFRSRMIQTGTRSGSLSRLTKLVGTFLKAV